MMFKNWRKRLANALPETIVQVTWMDAGSSASRRVFGKDIKEHISNAGFIMRTVGYFVGESDDFLFLARDAQEGNDYDHRDTIDIPKALVLDRHPQSVGPECQEVEGMKRRMIITSIDSIMAIMRDACKGELPQDAIPLKLMYNAAEKGKLAILAESSEWTGTEGALEVRFDLRRVYSV